MPGYRPKWLIKAFARVCWWAVASCCLWGASALDEDGAELPVAVVPIMAQAPAIDGVIAAGEWPTLHVTRLAGQRAGGKHRVQARLAEFWLGSDGRQLFLAVRSAVHPTLGAVAALSPGDVQDVRRLVRDDTIEWWIDADPGGAKGAVYRLVFNAAGAWSDQAIERVGGLADTWWSLPGFRQAHTVTRGIWCAEAAIPLAALGIAWPNRFLGVGVVRNFQRPWDAASWGPHSIGEVPPLALVRFDPATPVVAEAGAEDQTGAVLGVELTNPLATPLAVKVVIGAQTEGRQRREEAWEVTLQAGETRQFLQRLPLAARPERPVDVDLRVTDPRGETWYRRRVSWRSQAGDPWEVAGAPPAAKTVDFRIEWHPTPQVLRWRADFVAMARREAVRQLRVVVADATNGDRYAETRIAAPESGLLSARTLLADLPTGRYLASLYLDGEKPARQPVASADFEHGTDFPWRGLGLGEADRVIPPFTPLRLSGVLWEARTVQAVGRDHLMSGTGLWTQAVSRGLPLLAGPMRLDVRQGDRTVAARGYLSVVDKQPARVILASQWQGGDLHGTTASEVEVDGCMKVRLTLLPTAPVTIDGLDLVIPLRADRAPLMHVSTDAPRGNVAGAVPAGQGVVWDSRSATRNELMGSFVPCIWLGGEERGLCWFAGNDLGWVVDVTGATPAMAVERQGETLLLRIRLIQRPIVLTEARQIVFGLMATPAKPMPEETLWRRAGDHDGATPRLAIYPTSLAWGGQLHAVFPRDHDYWVLEKLAAARAGQVDTAFFDACMAAHPDGAAALRAAVAMRGDRGLLQTNLRGAVTHTRDWRVYQDEWRGERFGARQTRDDLAEGRLDRAVVLTPSRLDYLLYHYRELLRHGADGIAWEQGGLFANPNPITGQGYWRDDSRWQPETDIWALRELARRTAILTHDAGKPNFNLWQAANQSLVPVASWVGATQVWEWPAGDAPYQERYPREAIRAMSLGRQTGTLPCVVNVAAPQGRDPQRRLFAERSRAGVALTHELIVLNPGPLYVSVRRHLLALGIGSEACRVYNYWDADAPLQVTGIDAAWLLVDAPGEIFLVLVDYGSGGTARLVPDAARLGLPAKVEAVDWERPDRQYQMVDNALVIPELQPNEVRFLRLPK